MKINIVSSDKRYVELNAILKRNGYDSELCDPQGITECDVLILSLRDEYSLDDLKTVIKAQGKNTVVFTGKKNIIEKIFDGKVVDYSGSEAFLSKNAYLTAEATIMLLYQITESSLLDKKILVCGYGRIGKRLCRLLSSLGAKVYAYARRNEVKKEIIENGYISAEISTSEKCDIVLNTVPSVIFSNEQINKIPSSTYLFELASMPGGFESKSRVYQGGGLPGKILPKGSAQLIFDTIVPFFQEKEE